MARVWIRAAVLACGIAAYVAGATRAVCRPVDLSAPSEVLGSSDPYGYVAVWKEIGEIDAGQGMELPLRLKFTTAPGANGLLGKGFWLPLLEARTILIDERTVCATLICGKSLYLWRSSNDPHQFWTPNKEWQGRLDDKNNFVLWRDDGWTLSYSDGKISRLRSDQGRVLDWVYAGGITQGIKEGANFILQTELDPTGRPSAIKTQNQTYALGFDKRPRLQKLGGQNVIAELDTSLSEILWPDKSKESFEFGVSSDLTPSLLITDKSGEKTNYTWKVESNQILTESDWTYQVGPIISAYESPRISRTNAKGITETRKVDNKDGIAVTSVNGVETTYKTFTSPGPLFGKIRSIEKDENGSKRIVFSANYDEAGLLIRRTQMDKNGFRKIESFDAFGATTSSQLEQPQDKRVLDKLKSNERQMINAMNGLSGVEQIKAIKQLAAYYIFEMKDLNKAAALLPSLDHVQAWSLRLQSISGDENLSAAQKKSAYEALLKEYPEKRGSIEFHITNTK